MNHRDYPAECPHDPGHCRHEVFRCRRCLTTMDGCGILRRTADRPCCGDCYHALPNPDDEEVDS